MAAISTPVSLEAIVDGLACKRRAFKSMLFFVQIRLWLARLVLALVVLPLAIRSRAVCLPSLFEQARRVLVACGEREGDRGEKTSSRGGNCSSTRAHIDARREQTRRVTGAGLWCEQQGTRGTGRAGTSLFTPASNLHEPSSSNKTAATTTTSTTTRTRTS